ncbi:MAG: tRNA epoxyqueuosine(34) reductase QueG [Muribaculaceae bacterium]|nr:tRNA epoxyqueuosine(34) reductase QueG [Muribaculaceae bacterium]
MPSPSIDISSSIKSQARSLGFDACGFAAAAPVDDEAVARYDRWIEQGQHGCMRWAEGHRDLRRDPAMLLEGAQTVISLALNYYPSRFQPYDALRVAYYAYGRDYHEVLREKLTELAHFIEQITHCATRPCVDSAPIRERYWAQRAGLGFIGRNDCLILPGKGSFFFLGEIVTTAQLPPDEPCTMTCGDCGKCIAACPTGALHDDGIVDASCCLSCLLIENHDDELPAWVGEVIGNRVVGCDSCQLSCPHNAHAVPTTVPDFEPTEAVMTLTRERIASMKPGDFKRTFAHSAISRLRYKTLQRNAVLADGGKKA